MIIMEIDLEAKITQLLEMKDEKTGLISYLMEQDGEWVTITKEQYKELIGEVND